MSLEEAKKYYQQRIWDAESRETMQRIIDWSETLALVTGPAQIGKSSAVTFNIACQEDTFVVCIHQNPQAALRAKKLAQAIFGKSRVVWRYRPNCPDAVKTLEKWRDYQPKPGIIVYLTYGDIVNDHKAMLKFLFRVRASHVVMADFHERSVDQEIACHAIAQDAEVMAGPPIIMVSTYPTADHALSPAGLLLKARQDKVADGEELEICHLRLPPLDGHEEPTVYYARDMADIAGYKAWATNWVDITRDETRRKPCGILVFAPSNGILWELSAELKLKYSGHDGLEVVVLDPRDSVMLARINDDKDTKHIILMRPYFGNRLCISGVGTVICPLYDEQPVFDVVAYKEIPTLQRLAQDRIQFMIDHIMLSKQSLVCCGFTQTDRQNLLPTDRPLFHKGNYLEYLLKAIHVAPSGRTPSADSPNPTRLSLTTGSRHIEWAIAQLERRGLIESAANGYRATDLGKARILSM